MKRARLVLVAAAVVGGFGACAPTPDTSACATADEPALRALQAKVSEGTLRHGATITAADGRVFVSAELDRPDEDDDDEILTWTAVGPDAFEAVDEQARDHSDWPEATVDVRAEGARPSRACVVRYRDEAEAASTTTAP